MVNSQLRQSKPQQLVRSATVVALDVADALVHGPPLQSRAPTWSAYRQRPDKMANGLQVLFVVDLAKTAHEIDESEASEPPHSPPLEKVIDRRAQCDSDLKQARADTASIPSSYLKMICCVTRPTLSARPRWLIPSRIRPSRIRVTRSSDLPLIVVRFGCQKVCL